MGVATVNRDMAALRRSFRLAAKANRYARALPSFPFVKEHNVREGYFERDQFEAVRAKLPEWLRSAVTFMYYTGWRISETLGLQWRQVDLKAGVARLEPGTTKNREGRSLPFDAVPELREMIHAQRAVTTAIEREKGAIVRWVFHDGGEGLLDDKGRPRRAVYREWRRATREAALPGRLFHDFRRTAVRNLERSGVSRSVAMRVTGHKTESVYRRYAIVSESDIAEGLRKVAALAEKARS